MSDEDFIPGADTCCVDRGICPHCGKKFDAAEALNYDMSGDIVDCPHCGKMIEIFCSVEYQCSIPEEN